MFRNERNIKNNFCLLIITLLLVIPYINTEKEKNSKFDKLYKECSQSPQCLNRPNDEDCIYKCTSPECYRDLIERSNYILEFGEVDNEFKKIFKKCFQYRERITNRNELRNKW